MLLIFMANEGYFSFYLCPYTRLWASVPPSVRPSSAAVLTSPTRFFLFFFWFLNFWQRVFRMQTTLLLWTSLTQKAKGVLMAPQTPRTIVGGISSWLKERKRERERGTMKERKVKGDREEKKERPQASWCFGKTSLILFLCNCLKKNKRKYFLKNMVISTLILKLATLHATIYWIGLIEQLVSR